MERSKLRILVVFAAAAVLLPYSARADRGAVSIDIGPFYSFDNVPPGVGTGGSVTGGAYGGFIGLRYALTNSIELTAGGYYGVPSDYFHSNTTVVRGSSFTGSLQSRTNGWGAAVGARWVHGLVWRFVVGGEIGFARRIYRNLDLINVSDPSNPQSFGLGLQDASTSSVLVAPLAGVEWCISDSFSLSLTPRAQFLLGTSELRFLLPITFTYSFYPF